jgi:hypothetical protein
MKVFFELTKLVTPTVIGFRMIMTRRRRRRMSIKIVTAVMTIIIVVILNGGIIKERGIRITPLPMPLPGTM